MLFYRRLTPRASVPELASHALASRAEHDHLAPAMNGHFSALTNG